MSNKKRSTMISKLITALFLLVVVVSAVGFVALAAWDVPVNQAPVEKALENSRFLSKSS